MVHRGPWTGGQCFVHHPLHEMAWWSKSVFQQKLWSLKIYNSVISISPAEFSIHHKRLSVFNICQICYKKLFQVQGCIYFNINKVHRRIYEAFCSIFSFSVVNGRIWFPLKSSSSVSSLSSSIWGIINLFKRCEKRKSISINRTFTCPILRFSPRFTKIPGLAPVNDYQPRSYKQENIDWYQLIFSCN